MPKLISYSIIARHVWIAFILAAICQSTLSGADVIPAENRIDWSSAGVPGGIPNRTTIFQTLNPGSTAAQIQSALNACPSGQVVLLSAGNYTLTNRLVINRDNITLRGATDANGVPTTVLNFSSSAGGWGLIELSKVTYPDPPNAANVRDISTGYARGSTTLTLGSAPNASLQVGQLMVLDQVADDNLVWNNGTEGGGTWGRNGDRTLTQVVRVTAISGSNITFTPGIYSEYWSAARSPQAYWWSSGTSGIVKLSGIENLKINRNSGGGGTHNMAMGPADSCWIKNVWSTQCAAAHIRTGWTLNCELRDCYLTLHDNVGSATYSVWLTFTSGMLVENNIMVDTPCAVGMMSTTGSVIAYNFARLFRYSQADWLPECIMTHGGHCNHNLFEGNYVPSFWADWIHGNSSRSNYVRNLVPGWETGKTGSTRPINVEENQNYLTVVGNILGTAGYHNTYDGGAKGIYNLDSDSTPTLIRKGNWNVVNNAIPGGELLGADTVSISYFRSSKPAYFGDRPWPPFDASAPGAASGTNLPAGYRYTNGSFPPVTAGPPAAPTNLQATPN